VLSTSGVTLFLVGIVALAGTPTGLASVVYASPGLIGVAALLGADPHRTLDGRWLASHAAAWFFSIGRRGPDRGRHSHRDQLAIPLGDRRPRVS
jgi:hypothetical protein